MDRFGHQNHEHEEKRRSLRAEREPSLAAFAPAHAPATSTAAANHKIYGDSYFQQCAHAELNFIA